MLALYRDLIALRRSLGEDFAFIDDAAEGVLAFRRGDHIVALNLAGEERPAPRAGAVVRATSRSVGAPGTGAPRSLGAGEGFVAVAV
jgi:hypothetical protein